MWPFLVSMLNFWAQLIQTFNSDILPSTQPTLENETHRLKIAFSGVLAVSFRECTILSH